LKILQQNEGSKVKRPLFEKKKYVDEEMLGMSDFHLAELIMVNHAR